MSGQIWNFLFSYHDKVKQKVIIYILIWENVEIIWLQLLIFRSKFVHQSAQSKQAYEKLEQCVYSNGIFGPCAITIEIINQSSKQTIKQTSKKSITNRIKQMYSYKITFVSGSAQLFFNL